MKLIASNTMIFKVLMIIYIKTNQNTLDSGHYTPMLKRRKCFKKFQVHIESKKKLKLKKLMQIFIKCLKTNKKNFKERF